MYSFILEKISFQNVVTVPLEETLSGHSVISSRCQVFAQTDSRWRCASPFVCL